MFTQHLIVWKSVPQPVSFLPPWPLISRVVFSQWKGKNRLFKMLVEDLWHKVHSHRAQLFMLFATVLYVVDWCPDDSDFIINLYTQHPAMKGIWDFLEIPGPSVLLTLWRSADEHIIVQIFIFWSAISRSIFGPQTLIKIPRVYPGATVSVRPLESFLLLAISNYIFMELTNALPTAQSNSIFHLKVTMQHLSG